METPHIRYTPTPTPPLPPPRDALPPGYLRRPGLSDHVCKTTPGGIQWCAQFWPLTAEQQDQLADYGPRCWSGALSWDAAILAVLLAAGHLRPDRQLPLFAEPPR